MDFLSLYPFVPKRTYAFQNHIIKALRISEFLRTSYKMVTYIYSTFGPIHSHIQIAKLKMCIINGVTNHHLY